MSDASQVEIFYRVVQEKTGGNVPWVELDPFIQYKFVEAVNFIGTVASVVKNAHGNSQLEKN